jgi:hypothetical protein
MLAVEEGGAGEIHSWITLVAALIDVPWAKEEDNEMAAAVADVIISARSGRFVTKNESQRSSATTVPERTRA